jgi:hypothetical protein
MIIQEVEEHKQGAKTNATSDIGISKEMPNLIQREKDILCSEKKECSYQKSLQEISSNLKKIQIFHCQIKPKRMLHRKINKS